MAIKKLVYGTDEIRLSNEADIVALRQRIEDALNNKESRWVEIEGKSHPRWILITDGVPVSIETYEPQMPRGRVL